VDHAPSWNERQLASRALHRTGEVTSHAATGLLAAGLVVVWLVVGIVESFPDWWETVLYSVSASVTFVMVFAIQHTQSRQQSATQRKLDELLRSTSSADNRLIAVEEAPDEELEAFADLSFEDRQNAIP
jgi:low affinity Fe/Cu permease